MACEAQTHFRSSLLSLRKIAPAKCEPERQNDFPWRKNFCFLVDQSECTIDIVRVFLARICETRVPGIGAIPNCGTWNRQTCRGKLLRKSATMVNLVFSVKELFRSLKKKYVFGKSSLDITSLIHRALNVYLTVYVDREQLAICRTQCYSWIVRYKNAVQKVEEIGGEIKRNFGGDFPFRVKRMAKVHFNTSEAKKCLDFGDTPSTASPGTPTNLHVAEKSAEIFRREATTGNASALR